MKHINTLYIVWNDGNTLGIPIIDEQHRGIISTINSLYYSIQTGHGQEVTGPTIAMLEQYINVHFKTEETLMLEAGYPAVEEHIALHKKLVDKTTELSIIAGDDTGPEMLLKFLRGWWLSHINKEDRKYAPFLK